MTPFPNHIEANADLRAARAMMVEHGVRHLPVLRDGQLFGIVSETDILLAGTLGGRHDLRVEEICSRDPYAVDAGTPLAAVMREMAERRIGSALVLRHEKLAGIVTHSDVCRVFAALLGELGGESGPRDAA